MSISSDSTEPLLQFTNVGLYLKPQRSRPRPRTTTGYMSVNSPELFLWLW